MADLDRAIDEIRRFSSRPPAGPAPIEHLNARSSQRRRRRLVAAGALASVAIVLGGIAIADGLRSDEGQRVATGRTSEPTDTAPIDPSMSTAPSDATGQPLSDLVVEPDTGLIDGQTVTVSGPERVTAVALCDADRITQSDPLAGCDINFGPGGGPTPLEITVARRIQVRDGIVDCAERPGRCVVGVISPDAGRLVAPISFRDDLGDFPVPSISAERVSVADDQLEVVLSGFEAPGTSPGRDDEVLLRQCIGEPSDSWTDPTWERCDGARAVALIPDASGTARIQITLHAEILTYQGWQPCEPCALVASAWRQPGAVTPVEVIAVDTPIRPTLRIVPNGPYEPGQRVRLEGSHFGARGTGIQIGWCAFRSDDPETEMEGDVGQGLAGCAYPIEGSDLVADADGSLVVDAFPLSGTDVRGLSCLDPTVRCGLAWHPGNGMPPAFVALYSFDPG